MNSRQYEEQQKRILEYSLNKHDIYVEDCESIILDESEYIITLKSGATRIIPAHTEILYENGF
jgi:hypothetical protein